jgi:hypothetical protein
VLADRGSGKPTPQAKRPMVTGQPKNNVAEVGKDRRWPTSGSRSKKARLGYQEKGADKGSALLISANPR